MCWTNRVCLLSQLRFFRHGMWFSKPYHMFAEIRFTSHKNEVWFPLPASTGFCRLVPHPRSPGTWTVHFEGADCDSHLSAADSSEMVRPDALSHVHALRSRFLLSVWEWVSVRVKSFWIQTGQVMLTLEFVATKVCGWSDSQDSIKWGHLVPESKALCRDLEDSVQLHWNHPLIQSVCLLDTNRVEP